MSDHNDSSEARAVGPVPIVGALLAIMIVGAGLAIAYKCALLSLFDLDGARWWAAVVYLSVVHLLAVSKIGWLRRAIRASRQARYPVPSLREILSYLNSRAAWVTRLGLGLLGLFAAAHLLATSLPAVVAVVVLLVAVLSLDILGLGTWPARGIIDRFLPGDVR